MTYLLGHIYKDYLEANKIFVEDTIFKNICAEFNIAIIDYILEGKTFNMGNHLSSISIREIDRNNSKPTIDWGESNLYKKEILDRGDKLFDKETGEGIKWHNNQMAVKRLSASFYGILAFAGFGWSNVTLAESITASAREAIRSAAFKAKELEV